ncbi:MAG: RidA family protein [Nitratireductor sp.]|nr:RidA family protein [Nitratireductor sp.]
MTRQVIAQPGGTNSTAPYSPAIKWGQMLFVSGQTGSDPVTRQFPSGIKEQTRISLQRAKEIAESVGGSLDNALKVTIFMTDMLNEFQAMNEVFSEFFPHEPPARSTVGVAHLAREGLKVEIEMIIALD